MAGRSFVVQEHCARSHHFDLRLEIGGVLVSWAVPKGMPEDVAAKRLAIHVEDHPLEYGRFEGTIPTGNYGAGKVSIWDHGVWTPLAADWEGAWQKGRIKFRLHGNRLHGTYLLARMKEEPNWLLRKLQDAGPSGIPATTPREKTRFVSPQLARATGTMPVEDAWWHEIKFDGYRLIVVKAGNHVQLFTRNGLDWTDRLASLAESLRTLTKLDYVIDGEAVVFDDAGRSRFGDLQTALQRGQAENIEFVAFDLLHVDGRSLRDMPLSQRVEELAKIVDEHGARIRLSKIWTGKAGRELLRQACAHGLEGVISKNSAGRYFEGERRDWLKSKCRARQEFLICGFTPPKASLPGFGAIVLASFENGKLVARGKVGTGFTDRDRVELLDRFKPRITKRRILPVEERGITWIEPDLVAEIEFAEITRDGSIRQGSFIALREDKTPSQVRLEPPSTAMSDPKSNKIRGMTITHPERVVYPSEGITKLEVVRYYERIGEFLLPHVAQRPLSLVRAPDGITGDMFFQKSFKSHLPPHVTQKTLADETTIFFVKNVRGLISLAQFGAIEFHPWGARLPRYDRPDMLIWDLDPDAAVPWPEVQGSALLVRDFLADLGLRTLIKTSGGKGLHIVLFSKRTHGWEAMREFSKAVARKVAAYNPARLVITSSKSKRKGKIFIDWMRNGEGSTCIAPWSLRARAGAPVSMPINWVDLPKVTANGFKMPDPLAPPSEWLDLQPQLIPVALLRHVTATT